jgi:DNA-directed RNA polymerase specialized sigma24 family protein
MKEIGAALGRLDPRSRALLDLSLRRGMPDNEIAGVLRVDATEVERRRAEALEELASDLRLDGREQREELVATLPDLPGALWQGE